MNKSLASSEVGAEDQDVSTSAKPWGRKLRDIRESRDISVEEIAAELRLEVPLLSAIENEDLDALPSAPFVKGYIRSYARLLDVSDAELIAAYSELGIDDAPGIKKLGQVKETTSSHVGVRYATWGLMIVGAVSLLAWLGSNMILTATQDDSVVEETSSEVQILQSGEGGLPTQVIFESLPLSTEAADETDVSSQAETPAVETMAEPAPVSNAVVNGEVSAVEVRSGELVSITLRFSDDSWVEITDAVGERLFLSIGTAGSERTVEGVPPFSVLLGNAPAVSLEYNGAPYDLIRHNRKGVARFTLGEAGSE